MFEDAPSSVLSRSTLGSGGSTLADALVSAGLCASRGEARRTVSQGGVYLNNRRQDDPERVLGDDALLLGRYLVLRRGKRQYHLLRVE